MQTALNPCMVWSLYGLHMCKHFWPGPVTSPDEFGAGSQSSGRGNPIQRLSPLKGESELLGSPAGLVPPSSREHCQCSPCQQDHAQSRRCQVNTFATCHISCLWQGQSWSAGCLARLELQGWETLPIAILGMPNLPPAWVIETWKPVGGCKFTGYFSGAAGNSALRFCLLLKWRAIRPQATELFPAQLQGDSLSCLPAEDGDADVESVSTPSSDTSARRADRLTKAMI